MRHTRGEIITIVALCGPLSAPASSTLREEIITHIQDAHSSIDVLVYEVGSQAISAALIEARKRGVRIRVIVDEEKSTGDSPAERMIAESRIPMRKVSFSEGEMLHEKFIIFDGTEMATPSYNRTERNSEDEAPEGFVTDKRVIRKLALEFDRIWQASKP